MKKFFLITAMSIALLMQWSAGAQGSEFRRLNPIQTPNTELPKGAERVDAVRPVDRGLVRAIMSKVIGSWNGPKLNQMLGDTFFDKLRLDYKMTEIPRDAKLRLLGLQGMQTLSQFIEKNSSSGRRQLVSRVSVTARTQVEFNDLVRGFQRIPGVNEYVLQVRQNLKP